MISNTEEEHKRKNYLISVDGSGHSNWGFDLIFKELFKKGDHITVLHVSNENKTDIPFKYQADQIMSQYETKLLGKLPKDDFSIIKKPRKSDSEHALEVVYQMSTNSTTDMIILGTQGHKGAKSTKEISKGIMYIVKHISIPCLIIKEKTQREFKENKGFNWLVCIEDNLSRSFKVFEFVLSLIDKEKDTIIGLHFWQLEQNKELEDNFEKLCGKLNVKNRRFINTQKSSNLSIGKSICDYVNFGDDYIDFISIGHNISKYPNQENSPTIEIIKFAQANILFSRA
jgi:hypothetical protein